MKQLLTIISVIFATTLTSFAQNKGYVISGVKCTRGQEPCAYSLIQPIN